MPSSFAFEARSGLPCLRVGKSMETDIDCKIVFGRYPTTSINSPLMPSTRYAGFYPRLLAHNIDLVVLLPIFYLLGAWIPNNLLLILACWILYTLYHVAFELSKWQGTLGKKFQGMRVMNGQGQGATIQQIILRNATKLISIMPLFAGVILIAVDARHRGLHDRLAGTIVIFS